MFFDVFVFEVVFVLKIEDNLCLFALSWYEIKHKTSHCQRNDWSIFIHKIYKEKFITAVNLKMKKNESAG